MPSEGERGRGGGAGNNAFISGEQGYMKRTGTKVILGNMEHTSTQESSIVILWTGDK